MDSSTRRPQLPALSYLEMDNTKREEETYQSHTPASPSKTSYVASPVHQYPSGPPPPYTHQETRHGSSWPGVNGTPHTADSRRTSGDEVENIKQVTRQILPSISEAIGPLNGTSNYAPNTSMQDQHPQATAQILTPQSGTPRSPLASSRRSFPVEPPPNIQPHSNHSLFRQDSAAPQPYNTPEPSRTAQLGSYGPGPASSNYQPRTTYSEPATAHYEQSSSTSMPPPPSTFSYGYTSHAPRYAQTSQPSNSGPIYEPSRHYPAPQSPAPTWKRENETARYPHEPSTGHYGESVKRHFELYDLESALNEILQTSSGINDFARRYGNSLHQQPRAGPSVSSLPSLVEIDDMMNKSRIQLESLNKVRQTVLTEQAAYEQQLAEQRHKAYAEPLPQPSPMLDEAEEKYNATETKKRRGRAAPPGRCHSCQRAETPEWRRGPDGARTLCNACGLHYAKLTRKQQTNATKGTNPGGSNLRPKED